MTKQETGNFALALDFGGTKLAAAVVDVESGKIIELVRKMTPAQQGAGATLLAMITAGQDAMERFGAPERIHRVGISFGGPVSKDRKTVLHSHHVADWDGMALTDKITGTFHLPTFMDNDANAAALGEWYFGAGERAENMVYIQVSTGVGAGLILDGHLYRGNALAGEFGHITVVPNGPECLCGRKGCMESLCSGWAIARDGRAALSQAAESSPLRRLSGNDADKMDGHLVIEAYRQGDPLAAEILKRAYTNLGIGIANMICLFDPELVVLGGGITRAQDVMLDFLHPALEEAVHPLFKNRYRLKFSSLEGMETLLGAALLTD